MTFSEKEKEDCDREIVNKMHLGQTRETLNYFADWGLTLAPIVIQRLNFSKLRTNLSRKLQNRDILFKYIWKKPSREIGRAKRISGEMSAKRVAEGSCDVD